MNDSQILQRVLVLLTKRDKIIDDALNESRLLRGGAIVALREISDEMYELRAIQIANIEQQLRYAENVAKAYKKSPQRRQPSRDKKILITKGV